MTLDEFGTLTHERIPTPEEFLAFVQAQQWQVIQRPDGRPALRVPDKGDPLAVALARLLAREPYRTNVLEVAFPRGDSRPVPVRVTATLPDPDRLTPSNETRPTGPPAREFLWHPGHRCVQTPCDPRYAMEEFAPVGAWWWRYQGEAEWKAVPGRGGEYCSPLFPAPVSVKESP